MSPAQPSASDRKKADALYSEAMAAYARWDVEDAVNKLQAALHMVPDNADYHISLAQILARAGDFDQAMRALANFLRLEPNSPVSSRIEQLFSSGMDPVENMVTNHMKAGQMPIETIGMAVQMWMEFRIALGKETLAIPKPEIWAAALEHTVRKVNLREIPLQKLAASYQVVPDAVRENHELLVKKLDIMPCDYRYFTGSENPLDKLVEAAELLQRLEERFRQEQDETGTDSDKPAA